MILIHAIKKLSRANREVTITNSLTRMEKFLEVVERVNGSPEGDDSHERGDKHIKVSPPSW